MIIVCLVLVLAAFAVIGTALALAELSLVYVALGLGGLSAVLLAVETVRSRRTLFGGERAETLVGHPAADTRGAATGLSRTDGLGKASVRTTPVPEPVGAGSSPVCPEDSGEPALRADTSVPAPVSEPVRAAVSTRPHSRPAPPVDEAGEATVRTPALVEPADDGEAVVPTPGTGAAGDEETERIAPVSSGSSPDEATTVVRIPVAVPVDDEETERTAPPSAEADGDGDEDVPAAAAFSEPARWNPPVHAPDRSDGGDEDAGTSETGPETSADGPPGDPADGEEAERTASSSAEADGEGGEDAPAAVADPPEDDETDRTTRPEEGPDRATVVQPPSGDED